jgi:Sigma-70, region 4
MRTPRRGLGWRDPANHLRPMTRADCANLPRPCPFVGCRHNLYLQPHGHDMKITAPHRYPWNVPPGQSCALDCADSGGMTLEQIGSVLNCTRERVRQILASAVRRYQKAMRKAGYSADDLSDK